MRGSVKAYVVDVTIGEETSTTSKHGQNGFQKRLGRLLGDGRGSLDLIGLLLPCGLLQKVKHSCKMYVLQVSSKDIFEFLLAHDLGQKGKKNK